MAENIAVINCDLGYRVSTNHQNEPRHNLLTRTNFFFEYFTGGVYVSGIIALISCICYAIFAILSIIQIAMITSRDKVVLKYKPLVIIKLTLVCIAGRSKGRKKKVILRNE